MARLRCILLGRDVQLRDIDKLLALARQDYAHATAAQDASVEASRRAEEARRPTCTSAGC